MEIDLKAAKRRKITILQNFDAFRSRPGSEGLRTPIRFLSNSPGCQPYSIECENISHAILQKPGYPRLLIAREAFKDGSEHDTKGYCPLIWNMREICLPDGSVLNDTNNARQLLEEIRIKKLFLSSDYKVEETSPRGVFPPIRTSYSGSKLLMLRGSPDLIVEVYVSQVEFLDWTTPEVTVTLTEM